MTVDDATARWLSLDKDTRAEVDALMAGLAGEELAAAAALTAEITSRVGTFPSGPLQREVSNPVWVAAYVGAGPAVADWMLERGIGEPVTAATLSDVGRQLRLHHRHTGRVGLDAPTWPSVVLTGGCYELGRLQFDLKRRPADCFGSDSWVLDVHIPESGPLTPAVVEDSFDRAVTFFAEHFPDQPVHTAVCESWLLDPYLTANLAPTSNVVSFARLFTRYGEPRADELDALYFTFGQRSLDKLEQLPRRSSLQRVVLDRLAAGEGWSVVRGSRRLSPRTPISPSR